MKEHVIAQRDLLCCPKNGGAQKPFVIRVLAPLPVEEGSVNFTFDPGVSRCVVFFEGIGERAEFIGMDSLQALGFAMDFNSYLRGLTKGYDLFWPNGDPYFDD